MIQYEEKEYELKYNLKRLEIIEAATGISTLANVKQTGGLLGISSLKAYFAHALKEEGADSFVSPKKATEICESLIESEGYETVCGLVLECLQRDCPFFFPAA